MLADHQDTAFELAREQMNLRIQSQRVRLALTDTMAGRVIADHALPPLNPPPGLPDLRTSVSEFDALAALLQMPYSFDLGAMPIGSGSKPAFKDQVREIFEVTVERDKTGYPLLNTVGVTVFYVPSRDGKDLDNIFRELLPIMLNVFRPPRTEPNLTDDVDLWERVAAGDRLCPGDPTVSFIEAIALKGVDLERHPPGSVCTSFAPGSRSESWWNVAIESRWR